MMGLVHSEWLSNYKTKGDMLIQVNLQQCPRNSAETIQKCIYLSHSSNLEEISLELIQHFLGSETQGSMCPAEKNKTQK